MNEIYDFAVIGTGPAGSTFARLLDDRFSVITIDRKRHADESEIKNFNKPCGGLLATDAQRIFSEFEITLPKNILVNPQIFSVKTMDLNSKTTRHYQRFYLNMSRARFDFWLADMMRNRADIIDEAVCESIVRTDDFYLIKYRRAGEAFSVRARTVIGADGASSIVRKSFFPKDNIKKYTAIQQFFGTGTSQPLYSCIFDKNITDLYCWSISKDDCVILGGAFPQNTAKEKFDLLKEKLSDLGFDIENPAKTEACTVMYPRKNRDFKLAINGAFLIGEAAGFISPSSLEGISYAMKSAEILAGIFNRNKKNAGKAYKFATFKLRKKLILKKTKSIFMYNPFLRRCIMKSGIQTLKLTKKSDSSLS